jgi:chemotaxis protein CheZ
MTASINIKTVESLLSALQDGNQELATTILDELTSVRESEIYNQLNTLTNDLHHTLDHLDDNSLLMQTKHDIPDVTERLEYVIESTEEASKKVLDQAELSLQKVEKIQSDTDSSIDSLSEEFEAIKSSLMEIMMAQSYQDLTGQVLNRVILIITSIEQSLIELINQSSFDYQQIPEREQSDEKDQEMQGVGPNVTRKSQKDSVADQDEVDSLLDDLGI